MEHRQGDGGMASQGQQSAFPNAGFPVAHSMPAPGTSGTHEEEVFNMERGRDTQSSEAPLAAVSLL
jgi:hypothetical protein